jgi:hypothetical protein
MKEEIEKSANWHLAWIIQYWKGLLDFSFEKYFIYQMLPMVYGTLLVGIAGAMLYFVAETFIAGHIFRGLLYLFVAGPFSFLVIASIIRAMIELYIVIFRIAEDVDELVGIRDTMDKLSGLGDAVDQMSTVTNRIPFFKKLGDKKSARDAAADDDVTADDKAGGNDKNPAQSRD